MRLSDYEKVQSLAQTDTFILDTYAGTKNVLAVDLAKSLFGLIPGVEGTSELTGDDKLSIETSNGMVKIPLSDAIFEILDPALKTSYRRRRNYWRGKNLGSVITEEQWNEIDAGSFGGLFLGDYWTEPINNGNRVWRIVDFNYWFGTGATPCQKNHLVIMPDGILYNAKMNDDDTVSGGYIGSKMHTSGLDEAKNIINNFFGSSHVLDHYEYLSNAVTNGYISGKVWFKTKIELPNENMIYGTSIYEPSHNPSITSIKSTISKTQLAAMKNHPANINPTRQTYGLRTIADSFSFCQVNENNLAHLVVASINIGVRPVFGICKQNAA